ncbi:MAG: F0F1 ATP synthase subunit delta [Cyanobacteria bacterium J083]|nr:MAG: F0F1 ATP synthase subunit delta [Cyanobacteria bacterium J083]
MSSKLMSSKIAEPYAEALMSIAQEHNLTEQFSQELRSLLDLMAESSDFSNFVTNPVINPTVKKTVLQQVMGEESNPYLVRFLMLLVDKRRLVFLPQIAEQYLALLRELNQTVLAEVTAATELNDEQRAALVEKIKAMTNARDVELKITVDQDLLGGAIIKIGSKVIDASLRGQLRRISMTLSK